ncbi:MAG TPA: ribonuclease H-like domain-containing protein [Anaerovoracaceae bacterium]|nr:ribonuclease H-like domain-containing protein [Anaerovoracaceae bacterium]
MEIIRSFAEFRPYNSKVFNEYFADLSVRVMDIETDGLNPSYSQVILGGLLSPDEKGDATVTQYFLNKKEDEATLLKAYGKTLASADVLITYNGESFDLPFLNQRMKKYDLKIDFSAIQSFDLYRILHKYSRLRNILPNLKQKTIERYLGLSSARKDEISGRQSVALYEHYQRSGSEDSKAKILLHNRDDLVQLISTLRILAKLDLHKILFYEGFTVSSQDKRIIIESIAINKSNLEIVAKTRNVELDYYSFATAYHAVHKAKEKKLILTIPYDKQREVCFIDLESFGIDFTQLENYPSYESGFLIINQRGKTNYAEVNKAIRIVLSELLNGPML